MTDLFVTLTIPGDGSGWIVAESALPSTGTLALLGLVLLVQVALLVAALVDLLRRPDEAVTGGRRWVWILVVVLLQAVGPLAYFAAGRRPRPVEDPVVRVAGPPAHGEPRPAGPPSADRPPLPGAAAGSQVGGVVDLLYGSGAGEASRPAPTDAAEDGPGDEAPASGRDAHV